MPARGLSRRKKVRETARQEETARGYSRAPGEGMPAVEEPKKVHRKASARASAGLDSLLENHSAIMLFLDPENGRIVRANRAAVDFYGYSALQLDGLALHDIEVLGKVDARHRLEARHSASGAHFRSRHRLANGELRDVEIHSGPCELDGQSLLLFIITDITDRAQAETTLTASEAKYRELFEHSVEGIYRSTPDGRLLAANPALVRMLGYASQEDFLRVDIARDLYVDRRQRKELQRNLQVNGEARNVALELKRKDGTSIPVLDNSYAVRDEHGAVLYYEGTLTDVTELRHAEQALRKSEEQFRMAMDQSPIGMALVAPDGRWLKVNRALSGMLGYTEEELQSSDFQSITHPDDLDVDLSHVRELLEGVRSSYQIEKRYLHKSGRIIRALLSVSLVRGAGGNPDFFISQVQDITERKETEASLRESEERYRTTFERAAIGISETDLDGKYLRANDKLCEITGYTREELLRMAFRDITHPDDLAADLENLERLLAGDIASYSMEKRYIRKDGQPIWVEVTISLLRDPVARPKYVITAIKNIQDRKQAEDALLESEHKYRSIFENSVHGIYRTTADGEIISANPALVKMLGYDSEEELFRINSDDLYIFREDGEQMQQALAESGEVRDGVSIIRRKDGDLLIVRDNTRAVRDSQGNIVYYAGSVADITEERRTLDSLRRRAAELEVLYENSLGIGLTLEPRAIARQIIDVIEQKLHWQHAAIHLYHPESNSLELVACNMPGARPEDPGREIERLNRRMAQVGEGLSGWVVRSGEAIRCGCLPDDPRHVEFYPGLQSGLYVPMKVGEDIIGSIAVESELPDAFDEDDERLLMTLAAQAAVSIDNAHLFLESQRRATQFSVLYETVRDISSYRDIDLVLKTIVERATSLLSAPAGGIYLYDPRHNDLHLVVNVGLPECQDARLSIGKGGAGWVAEHRQPLIINDYQSWEGRSAQYAGVPFRAVLQVPMIYNGELLGVLAVDELGESERRFTDADMHLLSLFATQAAGALHNARLFEQTERRAEEFGALVQAGESLTSTLELQPLLENVLRAAQRAIPAAEKGTVLLWNAAARSLRIQAQNGYEDARILQALFHQDKGYSSAAFREKRSILVEDAIRDYEVPFGGSFDEVNAIKSGIASPLIVRGNVIGVIALDNATRASAFSLSDLHLLEAFALQAAAAIENARLFEQIRQRADEFASLYEATLDINADQDTHQVLQTISESVCKLLRVDASGVYLFDRERPGLQLAARAGLPDVQDAWLEIGEGLAGRVAQLREPMVVDDYATWEGRSPRYEGLLLRAILQVPMIHRGELIGILAADEVGDSNRKFSEADVRLLSLLASAAAGALYSARLLEQTKRRAEELGALARVSSALRFASTPAQMMPVLLDQLLSLLPADGAALGLVHCPAEGLVIELGRGALAHLTACHLPADIAGNIFTSREVYCSQNIQEDSSLLPMDELQNVRAAAAVPLIAQDTVIGVLWATRDVTSAGSLPAGFTEEQLRLFSAVADMAANAIHRASLHEQSLVHAEQMVSVSHLGRLLAETTDLETLYQRLAESLGHLLPAVSALFISLYDPETQLIQAVCAQADGALLDVQQIPSIRYVPGSENPQNRVIASLQPLITGPAADFPRPGGKYAGLPTAYESALYVPMLTDGKVIGLIAVQSRVPNRFVSDDVELLTLVANTAAVEIENTRLLAQFERHVQRLTALHAIDTAINSSTDLRLSLRVVLEQGIHLLDVEAASVMLLNPITLSLEFIAGSGFRVSKAVHPSARLGDGLPGKVALQRSVIQSSNLAELAACFGAGNYIEKEAFGAYVGVPLVSKGKVSGVLQLFSRTAPQANQQWLDFLNVLADQVALAVNNAHLFEGLERANIELTMAYDATIEGWSRALDLRDRETEGHTQRVTDMTLMLASAMGIPESQVPHIRRGALLHDIGKMGVPDDILRKPSTLSLTEWEIMRQHPRLAYELLSPVLYLRSALDIPYHHHEKWDGTGYPHGLRGEEIPLSARLFAVVDVYDALTSDRPYRPAWSREKALAYIQEQSGRHFDPHIVDVFLRLMAERVEV